MSSSNLEDLSKRVRMMTFSPSPFPRWVTCHGKGDVFYFNEMDLESNSKSGEDTLVWDYPGGEILGKIDGKMARAIFGPVRRASLAEDHGLIQPLSGGTDVMQKLQNSLLEEQGRPPREENNRLAGATVHQLIVTFANGNSQKRNVSAEEALEVAKSIARNYPNSTIELDGAYRWLGGKWFPLKKHIANTKESVMSSLLPVEIAQAREARFAEGDTAGWEAWMKTQPQTVQDDWQANKEKYGDKFKTAGMLPVEIAQLKTSKFSEGDTAGFEKWMKTQPKEVQDDWAANKEKYGDKFKTAGYSDVQKLQMVKNGIDGILNNLDDYLETNVSVSDYSHGTTILLKASKYIGDLIKARSSSF